MTDLVHVHICIHICVYMMHDEKYTVLSHCCSLDLYPKEGT